MLNQSEMMNHSQMMSNLQPIPVLNQSQSQQVMNNQNSQMMLMNQLINQNSHMMINQSLSQRGYGMWKPSQVDQVMLKNQKTKNSGYVPSRNNKNRRNTTSFVTRAGGYSHNQPTVNELHQQNRLKPKRYISKKFNYSSSKSAPFAPRNTTSFLIRAKKSGGITSLVSPCPVTPAVLPTPIFSPSREVLVDMAKEEWGVDGYGSMKGLIRLRSDGNDEEGGSGESDIEEHEQEHEHEHEHEHLEVEKRLDHDLSRFEMVYPNNGGSDHNMLENRVDDQDTHIAKLEEENMMLKERLFLMEREFDNLRMRLRSLETRREGARGLVEEVVENGSENESGSRGYGRSAGENSEVFENKDSVDNQESDNADKGGVAVDVHMEDGVRNIEQKTNVVVEANNKIEDDESVNGIAANVDSCVNQ